MNVSNQIIFILLLITLYLSAENDKEFLSQSIRIKEPVIEEPEMDKNKQGQSTVKKRVKIIFANKQWLKGELKFHGDAVDEYKLHDIASIEVKTYIKKFIKKVKNNNMFVFIPRNWLFRYKNGDEIFINKKNKFLHKIEVNTIYKKQIAYFYFYQYEQTSKHTEKNKNDEYDRENIIPLIPTDTAVKIEFSS